MILFVFRAFTTFICKKLGTGGHLQPCMCIGLGSAQLSYFSPYLESMRKFGRDGQELPSARKVSTTIFQQATDADFDEKLTSMNMLWGQFIDHDMTRTPMTPEVVFSILPFLILLIIICMLRDSFQSIIFNLFMLRFTKCHI